MRKFEENLIGRFEDDSGKDDSVFHGLPAAAEVGVNAVGIGQERLAHDLRVVEPRLPAHVVLEFVHASAAHVAELGVKRVVDPIVGGAGVN